MRSDGVPGMDHQLAMAIGEINGKLDSLAADFHDDREQGRIERRAFLEKLSQIDRLQSRFELLEGVVKGVERQTMSNKTQLEKFVYADDTQKIKDRHTYKILGVFGSIFTAIATGLWMVGNWAETNWHVFSALFKGKP
jgi:hypothetical protein